MSDGTAMGAARRGIVTGGTWCVDHNKLIEFWPGEDAVAEILSDDRQGGGSGCNLAIDMRRLDPNLPVETIGLVGDDDDGRFLLAEADAHGIGRAQLHVTGEAPTHATDAFCSKRSGRRTHIYYQGAAAALTPDHFDLRATSGRILHLGLPGVHRRMDAPWQGDANGWVAVLKRAHAAGLQTNLELVSLEPARIAALALPCLPHLDTLIVNDVEIGAIAGEVTWGGDRTDVEACVRAARRALELGPGLRLVAVHFPAGAVLLGRDGSEIRQAPVRVPRAEIVGANGAGDAFAAGLLYGLHEGWAPATALKLAHAAAAASLRDASTTQAVTGWRECLDLAERWGWQDAVG